MADVGHLFLVEVERLLPVGLTDRAPLDPRLRGGGRAGQRPYETRTGQGEGKIGLRSGCWRLNHVCIKWVRVVLDAGCLPLDCPPPSLPRLVGWVSAGIQPRSARRPRGAAVEPADVGHALQADAHPHHDDARRDVDVRDHLRHRVLHLGHARVRVGDKKGGHFQWVAKNTHADTFRRGVSGRKYIMRRQNAMAVYFLSATTSFNENYEQLPMMRSQVAVFI